MNKFYLALCFLVSSLTLYGDNITVTLGTGTTQGYVPVYPYYGYTYSQQLFTPSELTSGGSILTLKFYLPSSADITSSDDWDIFLGHTTKSSFASGSDWVSYSNLTLVYSGTVTNSSGVVTITLTTPFDYNGTDNLVLATHEKKSGYDGSADRFYSYTAAAGSVLYYYEDYTSPSPQSPPSGTVASSRAITTFEIAACVFGEVPTISNITKNSADLSWTVEDDAYNYEYYVSTSSTRPASGATATGESTDGIVALTNLSPGTDYYVWVRKYCSATESSNWKGAYEFTTPCASIVPAYSNDFNIFPGGCWQMAKGGDPDSTYANLGTSFWEDKGFLNTGLFGSAAINLFYKDNKEWLISPEFDFTGGGYRVSFDYGVTAWANSGPSSMGSDDSIQFVMSIDGGYSWMVLQTWDAAHTPSNSRNRFVQELPAIVTDGILFAFYASDGTIDNVQDYYFFVDNFVVETVPDPIVLDNATLDFSSANIQPCETYTVIATAYKTDYTDLDLTQKADGLSAWVGYSTTNTNPSSWTEWVPASYIGDNMGGNAFEAILSDLSEGNYYVASRFRVNDEPYQYGGVLGVWNATTNTSADLNVTIPAFNFNSDTTICEGSSVQLFASSNYSNYTFSWDGGTSLSTDTIVLPLYTTNYSLTVTDTLTTCMVTRTVRVTVQPTPTPLTVVASTVSPCLNQVVALSTTGGEAKQTGELGTESLTVDPFSYPNPLSGLYGGTKTQMIYTAAELTALGVEANNSLSSLGLYIENFVSASLRNFAIRVKHTSASSLNGFETGLTTVYSASEFTPTSAGWVDFLLSTPFVWNGTSNLLVEFIFNGGGAGVGPGTTVRSSSTTNSQTYYGVRNGIAGGIAAFDMLTSYSDKGSSNIRPNLRLGYDYKIPPTWSPITNLYSDANATIPYQEGLAAEVVYFKSAVLGSVNYSASVESSNCGGSANNVSVVVNDCQSGISDNSSAENVLIYPNPARDEFFITSNKTIDKVTIFNLSGMQVMNSLSNTTPINISTLADGVYFVRISFSDNTSTTQKLLKK